MKIPVHLSLCITLLFVGRVDAVPQAEPQPVRYHCDTGRVIDISYEKPSTARIISEGDSRVLTQERAASGARYAAGGWTWWSKGAEGVLQAGQQAARINCQQLVD